MSLLHIDRGQSNDFRILILDPCRHYVLMVFSNKKFPSPCGDVLYSPPPSERGRWRAVRAGRGAYSGCAFLTMEMRRSFKAPLPPCFAWSPSPAAAGEAGGSHAASPCGDVVLKLTVIVRRSSSSVSFRPLAGMCSIRLPRRNGGGGERCEPVGALAADVTFSRWRCTDRSRRPFHHAARGPPPPLWQGRLGFAFPSPCGDVVLKSIPQSNQYQTLQHCFRPLAGMWF